MTVVRAPWVDGEAFRPLIHTLGAENTRFVGGAVRDALVGVPTADIDLATTLLPAEVQARAAAASLRTIPTGIAHGTVTVLTAAGPVEVTTLRRDVATDGRHALVDFAGDWAEDAARRDFTINALYAHPLTGAVGDYHGGLADLAAGRVRFIGEPLQRIAEDHLRILRFFRFHDRFARGAPDAAALAACIARANDLMALSRERIAAELLKLLAHPDPAATVTLMHAAGLFAPVLPEIAGTDALTRLVPREQAAGAGPDPLRRMAALLPTDPAVAERVGQRLRLSTAQTRRLVQAALRDSRSVIERAYDDGAEVALDCILLGDAAPDEAQQLSGWQRPRLPISGGTLIARGVPQGPAVARTLRAVERAWITAGFPTGAAFDALLARHLPVATHPER